MLKELENDVLKKKKQQIAAKNPGVGVQIEKQKMKQSEKDEIEAMLNGL
jgi:Tfp pilus assembly protein PilZ